MALSTEEAAYNTAVDAAVTAWKALLATYSAGDRVTLVGINDNVTDGATAPVFDADGTRRRVEIYKGANIYRFDGGPDQICDLFVKVSNAAGDLT